jgi:multimeric flavodoxin WrbA
VIVLKVLLVGDVDESSEGLGGKLSDRLLNTIHSSQDECVNYAVQLDKIHYCCGCFNCWIKTPGICVFDDLGREISKVSVTSDVMVILSKVCYGTYSPPVRRTIDRLLPNVLPYFRVAQNGEIHHKPRYKKYPYFIFIGYCDAIAEDEKLTFKKLTAANALNFCSDSHSTYICSSETEISSIITEVSGLLKEWMVKR